MDMKKFAKVVRRFRYGKGLNVAFRVTEDSHKGRLDVFSFQCPIRAERFRLKNNGRMV